MIKIRNLKRRLNMWAIISFIIVALILIPNIDTFLHIFYKGNENWKHIKEYMLRDYIKNTLIIVIFTGVFTSILGVTLSWLISAYDFKGRKIFKWALILPLAIPPYIAAYTYNGIFSFTGIVNNLIGKTYDIMTIKGVIFIFTIFLLPYVYMVCNAFLEKQASSLVESARLLGRSDIYIFFRVILPLSKFSIIGGVTLVILEVLNDYGVVSYFGVPTFSSAIFKAWFSMGDINSAVKLSAILMAIVIFIIYIERFMGGRKKYSFITTKIRPFKRKKLKGITGIFAIVYCSLIMLVGIVIPIFQLVYWSYLSYKNGFSIKILEVAKNSFLTAVLTTFIIIILALIVINYNRIYEGSFSRTLNKLVLVGYSVPAAVIAIGVILMLLYIDRLSGQGRLLSSSIAMLIFAYVIRFLAISYQSLESGFNKVGKKFTEASRVLGNSTLETFLKVDIPMIKPALISAFILTFVDIIKELPLTLILRPFNYNTLATRAFDYAGDEMMTEAAVYALLIVVISIIAIFILNYVENKRGGE